MLQRVFVDVHVAVGVAGGQWAGLDPVRRGGKRQHDDESQDRRRLLDLHCLHNGSDSHTLLYANADLSKASQANEVLAFAEHWKKVSGRDPGLLIFDSKVTTQKQLAELDDRGIRFLTLRARSPKLSAALHTLPASAWKSLTVARSGAKTRKVKVHEDPAARLTAYPGTVRQLAVAGLGHDEPTILITNDQDRAPKALIERYAQRMNIEQRLAEAIRSFGLDALAGAVPLNVDLDVVLSMLAHTVCAALRRRLPGYATATPGHPATPVPAHRRDHPQPRQRLHRPARPARLLTRAPPSRPARPHRPLVGAIANSATSSPEPQTRLGSDSLRENRR